jgi:hypothetical protein
VVLVLLGAAVVVVNAPVVVGDVGVVVGGRPVVLNVELAPSAHDEMSNVSTTPRGQLQAV